MHFLTGTSPDHSCGGTTQLRPNPDLHTGLTNGISVSPGLNSGKGKIFYFRKLLEKGITGKGV